MTLRIMLVGLVASLGFELPSGDDVSCWAKTSSAWVRSQMLDPSGPEVETKLNLAGPSDCQQVAEKTEAPALVCPKEVATDAAFQVASDGMVAGLSADLLASHREGNSADSLVATEPPAPVGLPDGEESATKVAVETAAPASLGDGETLGCLVVPAVEAKATEAEVEVAVTEEGWPTEPAEPTVGTTDRLDRVSNAIRLTREAAQAWAEVLSEEGQPAR